jgi:hypothetical protein
MKTDKLTGIKIGKVAYQEGTTYTDGTAITKLLSKTPLGGLGSLDNFEAQFDVTKKRLSIFVSGDVAAMGFSIPLALKFVLDGNAKGKKNVAKDFTISDVGAGLHAGGLVNTEVIANAEVNNYSINTAFRTLGKKPNNLLKQIDRSSLEAYAGGNFAGQIGSALADMDITLSDRSTALGGYASSFGADWWNAGL